MNSLRLNGGRLNGARVIAALAFVTCTCTAQVTADVTRTQLGAGAISSSAVLTANPLRTTFGANTDFIGHGYLVSKASLVQDIQANVLGTAILQGYSLRTVYDYVDLGGSAEALFIPASVFSSSNILCSMEMYAEATKIQPGKVAFEVSGLFDSPVGLVYRMVSGHCLGTNEIRVESGINGIYEAFADPEAISGVLIEDAGLVTKQCGALLTGVAYTHALQTHIIQCRGSMDASGRVIAGATLTKAGFSDISGSALVEINPEYVSRAAADMVASALVQNFSAIQKHAAQANVIVGSGLITADPVRYTYGSILPITGSVLFTAQGGFVLQTGSEITGVCLMTAEGTQVYLAYADMMGTGILLPIGYENLMAPVDPSRVFKRPKTVRVFSRITPSRIFRK